MFKQVSAKKFHRKKVRITTPLSFFRRHGIHGADQAAGNDRGECVGHAKALGEQQAHQRRPYDHLGGPTTTLVDPTTPGRFQILNFAPKL